MEQRETGPVGVLALQGDFAAHRSVLAEIGVESVEVRTGRDLEMARALILPGGESTTIVRLLQRIGLDLDIRGRAAAGMPVFGTCAGMILLSSGVDGRPEQPTLGLIDATSARNAFGRQIDSFEADIPFQGSTGAPATTVRGVFIRAPFLTDVGTGVDVLSRYDGRIVAARADNVLVTAFHPELTGDSTVHDYFAAMVTNSKEIR